MTRGELFRLARRRAACNITIRPNRGVLKDGAIWATFDCTNLQDPTVPVGQQICEGKGAFIFENCSK